MDKFLISNIEELLRFLRLLLGVWSLNRANIEYVFQKPEYARTYALFSLLLFAGGIYVAAGIAIDLTYTQAVGFSLIYGLTSLATTFITLWISLAIMRARANSTYVWNAGVVLAFCLLSFYAVLLIAITGYIFAIGLAQGVSTEFGGGDVQINLLGRVVVAALSLLLLIYSAVFWWRITTIVAMGHGIVRTFWYFLLTVVVGNLIGIVSAPVSLASLQFIGVDPQAMAKSFGWIFGTDIPI